MSPAAHDLAIATGTHWVVEDAKGAVAGFLAAEALGDELHVWEMAVAFGAQGQGYGRKLLETAHAEAEVRRLRALTLTTFRDLAWNEAFYARMGFARLDELSDEPRLTKVLSEEVARGLPEVRRCAMRWTLPFATPAARPRP